MSKVPPSEGAEARRVDLPVRVVLGRKIAEAGHVDLPVRVLLGREIILL
jgi:hypothetical protein